jgi:hypothetical protein
MVARIFLLLFLSIASGTAAAQKTLVLFDGDGTRIGEFLYEHGASLRALVILGAQNDFLRVSAPDGALSQPELGTFRYESVDCTGQAYLVLPSGDEFLLRTGAQIVRLGTFSSTSFARVDAFPVPLAITVRSLGQTGDCTATEVPFQVAVPVTPVDPAAYGIQALDGDAWGVKPPFQLVVEQPDGMFCDGFEACPSP